MNRSSTELTLKTIPFPLQPVLPSKSPPLSSVALSQWSHWSCHDRQKHSKSPMTSVTRTIWMMKVSQASFVNSRIEKWTSKTNWLGIAGFVEELRELGRFSRTSFTANYDRRILGNFLHYHLFLHKHRKMLSLLLWMHISMVIASELQTAIQAAKLLDILLRKYTAISNSSWQNYIPNRWKQFANKKPERGIKNTENSRINSDQPGFPHFDLSLCLPVLS